jgi:hypothetical protein
MHPGGQAAAQVVREPIGNALAGADAAAAVDALDHRDVVLPGGTNGWEAGRGDPAGRR